MRIFFSPSASTFGRLIYEYEKNVFKRWKLYGSVKFIWRPNDTNAALMNENVNIKGDLEKLYTTCTGE